MKPRREAGATAGPRRVTLRVWRGAADRPGRFEEQAIEPGEGATVHEALTLARAALARQGADDASLPVWDVGCLEGSCGSCTLRVNGRARLACTTLLADVVRRGVVVIEPLARFPLVRDLVVDRSRQDEALARAVPATASAAAPGEEARGEPPSRREASATAPGKAGRGEPPELHEVRAALAACVACGACVEACPETGPGGAFLGAEAIAANRLARLQARDPGRQDALDAALSARGGIAECGKAQACADACPASVPLVEALGDAARTTTRRWLAGLLRR